MATVVLGVSGSIATYKACELTRLLVTAGHSVHVVMTQGASHFVTPLTFQTLSQNPVGIEMFKEPVNWKPEHISLAEKADIFVVAPCTANVMAKVAHGLADDLLTASLLATQAPILLAPAMNTAMWDNPATQDNLELLLSRNINFVDIGKGFLACDTSGRGRMAEPQTIYERIQQLLNA